MGLPGPIHLPGGTVGSMSILPGWVGVDARAVMSERLGLPVRVENDANLGALAELVFGAGRGLQDFVYIKVSSGIGAGFVIDGSLHRGAGGTAGEIGHITLDESGRVCRCGNRGCLETFVGAPFLLELLRSSHGDDLGLRDMIDLAAAGDIGCARVIADAGRHIGVGVANLCNLLSPQRVIVGGELARAGEALLPLGAAILLLAGPGAAAAFVVCYGASNGILTISRGALPLALFGPRGYPVLMGKLALPILLAQAAAPMLTAPLVAGLPATVVLGLAGLLALLALGCLLPLRRAP
jgi:hypothetical protein